MGQVCFGPELTKEQKDEIVRNKLLNQVQRQDRQEEERRVKLLLLGAGESGKSTLFKQMRINYLKPYSDEELMGYRDLIWRNIVENFKVLLQYVAEQNRSLGPLDPVKDKWITDIAANSPLTPEMGDEISQMWNSPSVQQTWSERSKYQLLDSLDFYCTNIDRIARPTYQPQIQDYLLARVRSTGMVEQTFTRNKVEFVIIDVGGQRSERRKWIQCFDNVTAIIFVAAVNEFDQTLFEDTRTNRMKEALQLLKNILNFKVFRETPIILFMNKVDLFEKKLKEMKQNNVNLNTYFPELALGTNYDGAEKKILEDIKQKFESLAKSGKIYSHYVTATETDNVRIVFDSTVEIVLSRTIHTHFYV